MPDRQGVSSPQPFKDRTTSEFLVTTIGGCFLAFNAGYLNGTTMEDNGVSTTHVSGTATRFGRYMADEDKYNITLNGGTLITCMTPFHWSTNFCCQELCSVFLLEAL